MTAGKGTKIALLVLPSIIAGLLVSEAGFRLLTGVPLLSRADFRNERVVQVMLTTATQYDPVLGWTLTPNYSNPRLNSREYGIRRNGSADRDLSTGAILVVGSSFAAGSEALDFETWPAQLENLVHERVLNASVGGYAVDQVVLRSQQLLPILQPRTLIVEAMDLSIQWNGYSITGRPKPYFTVENGRLVAHNSPVPALAPQADRFDGLKKVSGHSLVIEHLMSWWAPDAWYASPGHIVTPIQNDEVDVSCRLLAGLKDQADASGVRTLLLAHVAAQEVIGSDTPPNNLRLVEDCSRTIGLQVVSTFPAFKAIQRDSVDHFKRHYVMHGETFGHMSPLGNHLIAETLAAALAAAPPPVPAPGDGRNLIRDSEFLDQSFRGTVGELTQLGNGRTPHEFRLVAKGPMGEHYVGSTLSGLSEGSYTLSFEVHPTDTPMMRAQILDAEPSGVVCDVDFKRQAASTVRVGSAQHLFAGVKPVGGGWYRVWLAGQLPGAPTTVLLQLTGESGSLNFIPGKELLAVRKLQLERGQRASPYHVK